MNTLFATKHAPLSTKKKLVSRLVAMLFVFFALVSFARSVSAQELVPEPPPDVPTITGDVSRVHIPQPPASFVHRDIDGWLSVYYDAAAAPRIEPVFEKATQFRDKLASDLGQPLAGKIELRVTRTFEEMAALAPEGAPPPAYAVAVAYPGLRYMMLSLSPPTTRSETPDIEHSFEHELSHIALNDAVAGHHVPLWFNEGLSLWNAHEVFDHVQTMTSAAFSKELMPFKSLDRRFPATKASVAYAQSADFMRFLMKKTDAARFRTLIGRVRDGEDFYSSMGDAYGSAFNKLEYQWREDVARRYPFLLTLLGGGSILWVFGSVLIVVAYVKRKRRSKAILERWEQEEAEQDRQIALVAETPLPPAKLPRVEHEGEWFTLH